MSQEAGACDAAFEVLSAVEADRVTARYAPLADAVRELVDATVRMKFYVSSAFPNTREIIQIAVQLTE